jgi:hypothetical protein
MGGLADGEEREDEMPAGDEERIYPMLKTMRKNQKTTINRGKKTKTNPTKPKTPTKRPSKKR